MDIDRSRAVARGEIESAPYSGTVDVAVMAAFVDERNGGNIAGVVLDRPDLDERSMQSVAAQLAFSETAFLTEEPGGFRFDVFTPTVRVPDCGHATIASFGLLAQRGRFTDSTVKHTIVGPRAIRLDGDRVFMQQLPCGYEEGPAARHVAASLGLSEATSFQCAPTVARHDVGFLLVAVSVRGMLEALVPNMRAIEAISATADVLGYYAFAPGDPITARMFAPRIGIPEESATGMAAGLLSAFLFDRLADRRMQYTIEQGIFMHPPSPSRLETTLDVQNGTITSVWVGGAARLREIRRIRL